MPTIVDSSKIWEIWDICQRVYLHHGRRITFPKETKPEETYQWRYLCSLSKKFDEWEFDNGMIEKFIDVAIRHVKSKNKLHKGLSALCQSNLPEICYKKLTEEQKHTEQWIDTLKNSRLWLAENIRHKNPVRVLLYENEPRFVPNIVMWYQSNKLCLLYIALSKTCSKAIKQLQSSNNPHCSMLPDTAEIFFARSDFLESQTNIDQAKKIFKSDWRN